MTRAINLPVDELIDLYVNGLWSSFQLAERYGCCAPVILNHLRTAGVVRKKGNAVRGKPLRYDVPNDALIALYVDELWSCDRIALKYGCSSPTIRSRLVKAGVAIRASNDTKRGAPSPLRQKISDAEAVRLYTLRPNASLSEVARTLGCHVNAVHRALDAHGIERKSLSQVIGDSRKGSLNANYRPDLTDAQRASRRDNAKTVAWRKQVYERDGFACVRCGDAAGGNLNAHHIQGYSSNVALRWEVSNGATLCTTCHRGFHSRFGIRNNTAAQLAEWIASCPSRLTSLSLRHFGTGL